MLLQYLAEHEMAARATGAVLGLLIGLAITGLTLSSEPVARHERGVRCALPNEILRHRRADGRRERTWAGTRSPWQPPRSPAHHAVDEAAPQRTRAANRYGQTLQISLADLELLLSREAVADA
jgi:hypothetical protein